MIDEKEQFNAVASVICGKHEDLDAFHCFAVNGKANPGCFNYRKCRIGEKNNEQLSFVTHPIDNNSFLKACAGSGKTEVVGLKAAFEIRQWKSKYAGIAVLTFTNNAASVIKDRVLQFVGSTKAGYPHFIGTFDSWLHGYIANPFLHLVTEYVGKDNDRSIRVVDDRSDAGFLNSFKTKYQYWNTGYIKANEYSFETNGEIVFSSSSQLIDQIRSQNQVNMEHWRASDLIDTKKRFWRAGFATYEDIEYLCHAVLGKHTDFAYHISRRFPLILVDECQDLSEAQLQILQKLIEYNCNIHIVGDLNQGIYSFRNVNPESVRRFAEKNNFTQLQLSNNFRSYQPIVDFSGRLVDQDSIIGRQYKEKESICFYVTYKKKEISKLPDRFIEFLRRRNVAVSESVILTRNNNTVAKLRPGVVGELKNAMFPAVAIKIWKIPNITIDQVNESLSCMGRFIARQYFSSNTANKSSHYCPDSIKSQIVWRLFLSDVLSMCCAHHELSNFEQTWTNWAKLFRNNFDKIVVDCHMKYDLISTNIIVKETQYSAPKGFSSNKVSDTIGVIDSTPSQQIRITNFHQIKGETKDAVMVVSSPTNQGGGEGFWRNWLNNKASENARFAYVASSRPKNLLVWAIPEPVTDEDRKTLEALGLNYEPDF